VRHPRPPPAHGVTAIATPRNAGTARAGETAARLHLHNLGYRVLATNFRTREGEIDIVARHDDAFVFVEVKTRRGRTYGLPEEAITPAKTAHLIAAARTYLEQAGQPDAEWRIDVVAVELGPDGRPARVELHRGAVSEDAT